MLFRVQFSFLEILLKSVGVFQVTFFVFKKAAKPLGSDVKKYWLDIIKNLFFCGMLLNIIFLANIEFNFIVLYKGENDNNLWETRYEFDKVTCTNFYWMFNSLNEITQTCIFFYVVSKIEH